MMISVVVMTRDRAISTYLGTKKQGIIAPDIAEKLQNLGHAASISSLVVRDADEAVRYFSSVDKSTQAVVLLCEDRLAPLAKPFRTSFFTSFYDSGMGGTSTQNYLRKVCAKVLKAFLTFLTKFEDEKYRRLLLLPLRNFIASEVDAIYHLFAEGIDPARFGQGLDSALAELRVRQRPKTSGNYPYTYVIDDESRYFTYGKEHHARVETKCPPHNMECLINADFRFGRRYDRDRHFNVTTEGDRISGVFTDCHGCRSLQPPATHMNVFPNDFFV